MHSNSLQLCMQELQAVLILFSKRPLPLGSHALTCGRLSIHLGARKGRGYFIKGGQGTPRGARKAAIETRWTSGSSPVRYLRMSVTLFSRAATSERFSSLRRRAIARKAALLPLRLLTRLCTPSKLYGKVHICCEYW